MWSITNSALSNHRCNTKPLLRHARLLGVHHLRRSLVVLLHTLQDCSVGKHCEARGQIECK